MMTPARAPVELSLVVPCLNEEENIPDVFTALSDLCRREGMASAELLVLDDGSTDGTYKTALQQSEKYPNLNARVIRRLKPRRGYGAVVRFGIAHSRGEYIVPVAADLVDPIDLIPEFLLRMRAGADLVQCSRYLTPGDEDTIPFTYKFFQAIWRRLVRVLIGCEISDTTYAFRIFRRADALAYGVSSNRFNISPDILFKTLLRGGKVDCIARGQGIRRRGVSKFVFRREGPGYAYVLIRAFLHRLNLVPWF